MKVPMTYLRLQIMIAFGTAAIMLSACNGSGGGGTGGGDHTDNRDCLPTLDNVWTADGTQFERTEPRKCPYTVAAVGNPMQFAFFVDVPYANVWRFGESLYMTVADAAGTQRYANAFYLDQWTPGRLPGAEEVRATVAGDYPGGYPAANGGPPNDLAHLQYVSGRNLDYANMYLTLPGRVDPGTGSLTPPRPHPNVGVPATWRVIPYWDTTSYRYAWDVDGTPVGSGASATVTLNSVGDFTLRAVVTRSDNTSYTLTQAVSTVLSTPEISGPHYLPLDDEGQWNAVPVGGIGPYTYTWIVGGVTMQDGASSSFAYTPQSSFTLTLYVHDSNGAFASGGFQVTVLSCGPNAC